MDDSSSPPTEFVAPTLEELVPLFPAYEIDAFIAQGGMGAVYKARQKSLDRDVAIKILPREFGDDPQFRASFEAEAKAMARLNHPNLISVYDFGDIDGMLFIIMEFVKGKALFYSAHKKIISPKVAIPLVSTICRGLAHAHKAGIIHRDIKPANILLDIDATPKIGDFGLARPADLNDSGGAVFGTPGYTAPEIFQCRPVDERSDVFSVGAMLYELTSGKAPEANTYQMSSGVAPRLDAIIKKATHPDPAYRHSSADELADELDQLTGSLNSTPNLRPNLTPVAPRPVVSSGKSGSKGPIFATLAAVLCGLGVFAYFLTKKDKGAPPITEATVKEDQKNGSKKKKKGKQKKHPQNQGQNQPDKVAKHSQPEKKPDSSPMPEPKIATKPDSPEKENVHNDLERLRQALRSRQRSEFPSASVERNGSQYLFIDQKRTWSSATLFAKRYGAQLAVLKTADDLKWAQETFQAKTALWLGASDSGMESKWHWNEGQAIASELWSEDQPDNILSNQDGEDFLALSAGQASLEDLPEDHRLPFLIEWKLDGSQPGSLEAQLERTGAAFAAKSPPIFPNGTRNIGGSRFLFVAKKLSWLEASSLAQKAGGHLAVPSNLAEATYLTNLMSNTLSEGNGSWIGGQRTASGASTWTTVTGERFAFLPWLPNEPDNHNGDQDTVKIQLRGEKIGLNDTHISGTSEMEGNTVESFVIEWSHPSMRNMPAEGEAFANSDPYAAPLTNIRNKVIERHGRHYLRYRTKKEKIITKFVDNSIEHLEAARSITASLVENGKLLLQEIKESMEMPHNLPAGLRKRLGEEFDESRDETKELWSEYQPEFDKAKSDYLEALVKAANSFSENNDSDGAQYFTKEIELIESDNSRLSKIFRNEPVEAPTEESKEPAAEGKQKKLYIGEWESEGAADKKVRIILRPNGTAVLKSHGGGTGEWAIAEEKAASNITINGFKIEVRPIEGQLHAIDQEGNSYLLSRLK